MAEVIDRRTADDPATRRMWFWSAVIVTMVCGCAYQYWLFFQGLYTITIDDWTRTLYAFRWYKNPASLDVDVWLPLPHVIMGAALYLHYDLISAPRAVCGFFGLVSLALMGWFSWVVWRRHLVTLITMALGVVCSVRAVSSAAPMSEIFFCTFVLGGSVFYYQWIVNGRWRFLYTSASFIALSSACRYEGWTIALVLGLCSALAIFRQSSLTRTAKVLHVMALAILLAMVEIIWMVSWKYYNGSFLGFFSVAGDSHSRMFNPENKWSGNWEHAPLHQFLLINAKSLNLLGMAGLLVALWSNKLLRRWLWVPGLSLLIISMLGILGYALPLDHFWRTQAPWTLMLVPFTAYALCRLQNLLPSSLLFVRRCLLVTATCALLFSFHAQTMDWVIVCARSQANLGLLAVSRFIRQNVEALPAGEEMKVLLYKMPRGEWAKVWVLSNAPDAMLSDPRLDKLLEPVPDWKGLKQWKVGMIVFRGDDVRPYLGLLDPASLLYRFDAYSLLVIPRTYNKSDSSPANIE